MTTIDAMGKACPMPVILAKKQLDSGAAELAVLVDNDTAVQNLTRLGENSGYTVAIAKTEAGFCVAFQADGTPKTVAHEAHEAAFLSVPAGGTRWVLFVGSEGIGSGSAELGGNLMTMLFYTLAQGTSFPSSILFMNGGVKLPTQNEQVVEHLRTLQEHGCEILVCGTCLNFYGIAEQLKIGTVSNMYDISARMLEADKVLSF